MLTLYFSLYNNTWHIDPYIRIIMVERYLIIQDRGKKTYCPEYVKTK